MPLETAASSNDYIFQNYMKICPAYEQIHLWSVTRAVSGLLMYKNIA